MINLSQERRNASFSPLKFLQSFTLPEVYGVTSIGDFLEYRGNIEEEIKNKIFKTYRDKCFVSFLNASIKLQNDFCTIGDISGKVYLNYGSKLVNINGEEYCGENSEFSIHNLNKKNIGEDINSGKYFLAVNWYYPKHDILFLLSLIKSSDLLRELSPDNIKETCIGLSPKLA